MTKEDDMALHIKLGNLCMKNRSKGERRWAVMRALLARHLLLSVSRIFISTSLFFSESFFLSPSCKLRRQFNLNGIHKAGNVILGGLFEVHYSSIFPELTFTSEPHQPSCQG